ncbi:glycosyltransferase family 2 protein [Propionibacteriaceae bacterium Y1923]|uniref:glycosyltransferase family 2 protein n=1 Tax=Aestuariimicrobium sp. Y1814 TaxID=3418742 RepID=UPI003C162D66
MESVDVSVVVPCYNAAHQIADQLEALARQVNPPAFEVVVVDNRSTDGLDQACAPFAGSLRVRIVRAWERAGVCHARNEGVRHAAGATVLICDSDDIVDEHWVRAMSAAVGQGGRIVAGELVYDRLNSDLQRQVLDGMGVWQPAPYMGYLPFAFGCCLGITREDYLAIGGMDESMVGGSDDVDFSWRAQESGLAFVHAEEAQVHYRLRESPAAVLRQRRAYQRGDVLLWVRSMQAGRPVSGKSFKWSLQETLRAGVAGLRWIRMNPEQRLGWARRFGGALGSLEGHVRYRLLGRAPTVVLAHPSPQ